MSDARSAAGADERPPTRVLTEDECWNLLGNAPYGRVATFAAGEIDVFPVNHAVSGREIVFRTSAGTKLIELTIHQDVAFEVDGYDATGAFSVVVKGRAEQLETTQEIETVEPAGVHPWAPEEKDRWVRITPRRVTGRAFTFA